MTFDTQVYVKYCLLDVEMKTQGYLLIMYLLCHVIPTTPFERCFVLVFVANDEIAV